MRTGPEPYFRSGFSSRFQPTPLSSGFPAPQPGNGLDLVVLESPRKNKEEIRKNMRIKNRKREHTCKLNVENYENVRKR